MAPSSIVSYGHIRWFSFDDSRKLRRKVSRVCDIGPDNPDELHSSDRPSRMKLSNRKVPKFPKAFAPQHDLGLSGTNDTYQPLECQCVYRRTPVAKPAVAAYSQVPNQTVLVVEDQVRVRVVAADEFRQQR